MTMGARAAQIAVVALFVELGFGFGSWAVRIPDVQQALGLGEAALGVALLSLGVGSLVGMPLAGIALARLDQRVAATGSAVLLAVGLALPAAAPNLPLLCVALLVLGMGNGAHGVAMNAQGASLEAVLGRALLSRCHGFFSIGALVGSLSSALIAGVGVPAPIHLAVVAAALLVVTGVVYSGMLRVEPASGGALFVRPDRTVARFGLMAFAVLFVEGAVTDWSAVHLRDELGAGPVGSGIGFTAFALAMAGSRLFLGDRLVTRMGRQRLVRAAGVLATIGTVTVVVAPTAAVGWLGYLLIGAGASVVFPNVLAGAAATDGRSSGSSIAAVSSVGYLGFLIGPPLIGFVAEWGGLRVGLAVTILCAVTVSALAGALRTVDRPVLKAP